MKKITYSTLLLSLLFLVNGCSSKEEIINVSSVHAYSSDYGLVEDQEVDAEIEKELLAQNDPVEIDDTVSNPEWTTKLEIDPDAVTADKIAETKTVISYKYQFDPKFHDKAIWRSME